MSLRMAKCFRRTSVYHDADYHVRHRRSFGEVSEKTVLSFVPLCEQAAFDLHHTHNSAAETVLVSEDLVKPSNRRHAINSLTVATTTTRCLRGKQPRVLCGDIRPLTSTRRVTTEASAEASPPRWDMLLPTHVRLTYRTRHTRSKTVFSCSRRMMTQKKLSFL